MRKHPLPLLFLALCTIASAQTDRTHTNQSAITELEYYLSRADEEQTLSGWQTIAEYGINTITAQWESTALLAENVDIAAITSTLHTTAEAHLTEWLIARWFANVEQPDISPLVTVIKEQNLTNLYSTNEGTIVVDSAGDPVPKGG